MDYLHTLTVPTPFAVGPVNLYLVEGEELTLIDTGPIHPDTLDSLQEQLAARGIAFKDIRRVIITHAHVDHFGLAAQIVAASGARVYSHPRNRWWLTDFENEWSRRYDFFHDLFVSSGAPVALADRTIEGMRGFMQYGASIPAKNFFPIADSDRVALSGVTWRVINAPGHASGLIILYEAQSRTLLSNDHLLLKISSNPVIEPPLRGEKKRPRMLVDYLASLDKTARLDAQIALTGHGEPVRDVRGLIAERIAFHRARLERIEKEIAAGAATSFELMGRFFPKIRSVDFFLALSEVIGHLDVLEAEGRIYSEQDQIIHYFSAPTSVNV